MDSQAKAILPVIDFSKKNLEKNTMVRRDVQNALEEFGCFVAMNYELPPELHSSAFSASRDLYDLPVETKVQNTSIFPGSGYGGGYVTLPLFEYFSIDNAATLEGTEFFTNLMWPDGNDHFCKSALSFSKALAEMSDMVLRMVFENYGVKSCNSQLDSHEYILRLIKYKAPMNDDNNRGLHPHTDMSFLTILALNQVSGLEIQTKDGNWMGFKPFPSALVVLAGDGLMAWSNGRVYSALHRVTMKGYEDKYTIALFAFASGMIETAEELVDDEHPLQFKPFNHYAYLHFCGGEGLKHKNPIKVYCGI
jgi:isopenicillin N synthase-like dioxygenase